jgi:hypothetical protein
VSVFDNDIVSFTPHYGGTVELLLRDREVKTDTERRSFPLVGWAVVSVEMHGGEVIRQIEPVWLESGAANYSSEFRRCWDTHTVSIRVVLPGMEDQS